MFSKTEKTRFNSCPELQFLNNAIKDMRNKKDQLKNESDKTGINTLEYRKYKIFEQLLKDIDALIDNYNKSEPSTGSLNAELKDISMLVAEILHVSMLEKEKIKVLREARSEKKSNINQLFRISSSIGLLTAGTIVSGPLLGAVGFFGGDIFSSSIINNTGMNTTPESALIYLKLNEELWQILSGSNKVLGKESSLYITDFKIECLDQESIPGEKDMKPKTIYAYPSDSSVVCIHKDLNGIFQKQILSNKVLTTTELTQQKHIKMSELNQIMSQQKHFAIKYAIYKNLSSSKEILSEEIGIKSNTIL